MAMAATPSGTPTPIPAFAPFERPLEGGGGDADAAAVGGDVDWTDGVDIVEAVAVAESVVDVSVDDVRELVEVEELELAVLLSGPGTPMVVKAKSSFANKVVFLLVVQLHEDPTQQNVF